MAGAGVREDVGWREGSAGKEGVVEGDSCGYCAVASERMRRPGAGVRELEEVREKGSRKKVI